MLTFRSETNKKGAQKNVSGAPCIKKDLTIYCESVLIIVMHHLGVEPRLQEPESCVRSITLAVRTHIILV